LDLMILDLGLPDRDGIEVLKGARGARIHVPILVLTGARCRRFAGRCTRSRRRRLPRQAFAFAELVARIAALVRRAGGPRWAPASELRRMRDDLVAKPVARRIAVARVRAVRLLAAPPRRVVTRIENPA